MGKKTKLREAQRQHAADTIAALLAHSKRKSTYPALVATYGDFKPHYRDRLEAWRAFAVCAPEKWRCRIRSRAEDDRFLDLVKFVFARYPLAAHFDSVWLDAVNDDFVDRVAPRAGGEHGKDLRGWYIVTASGGSLYQHATRTFLSRSETHHFLTTPAEVTETHRAFWYAVARGAGADCARAIRVSFSQLVRFSIASTFWKQTARFFAGHDITVGEMNGLIEFIYARWQQDNGFSLKGRSINALLQQEQAWRQERWDKERGYFRAWKGRPVPDAVYTADDATGPITWRFRQIKTGAVLILEGQAMNHCVATYQARCAAGESAIWSLIGERPGGEHVSRLTIEVRHTGTIGECRGSYNRFATNEESAIIRHWADEFGFFLPR